MRAFKGHLQSFSHSKYNKHLIGLAGGILFVLFTLSGPCLAASLDKSQVLTRLKSIKSSHRKKLVRVDKKINEVLNDTHKSAGQKTRTQSGVSDTSAGAMEREIDILILKRKELLLRIDFLDRLSFRVQRHYRGKKLQDFLSQETIEMAQDEALSSKANTSMWKFLTYLSVAVKDLPERGEELISFVEGFMDFSTLVDPKSPDQFVKERNFINGRVFQRGEPMAREKVGEALEERLNELRSIEAQQSKLFEENKPLLKAPAQVVSPSPAKDQLRMKPFHANDPNLLPETSLQDYPSGKLPTLPLPTNQVEDSEAPVN